jgi:hypothetical protein
VLLIAGLAASSSIEVGNVPILTKLGVNPVLGPDLGRLIWLGCVPLVGGLCAFQLARRDHRIAAVWTSAAASTLFTASVLIVAAGVLNPHQTSAPLASAMHREQTAAQSTPVALSSRRAAQVASFRHSPPSLIFYAEQHVERLKSADEAANYLSEDGPRFLITTDVGLKQLQAETSHPFKILERRPRFPRTGEVLLISTDDRETPKVQQAAGEAPALK